MKKLSFTLSLFFIMLVVMGVYLLGIQHGSTRNGLPLAKEAIAAQMISIASPIKALRDRDVYYPGTEDLAPDEMRVVALGTGMPTIRPKQAAACFLLFDAIRK